MNNKQIKQKLYYHSEAKNLNSLYDSIKRENFSLSKMFTEKASGYEGGFKPNKKFKIMKRSGNLEPSEKIYWGVIPSVFGNMLLASSSEGLCGLAFYERNNKKNTLYQLTKYWLGESIEDNAFIRQLGEMVFSKSESVPLHLIGTNMQMKVWEKLLCIPYASVKSYSYIAKEIGNPSAVRAVASAVGSNPISWIIPCHRILSIRNKLSGYRWGLNVKITLLSHEFGLSPERLFDLQYSCLKQSSLLNKNTEK